MVLDNSLVQLLKLLMHINKAEESSATRSVPSIAFCSNYDEGAMPLSPSKAISLRLLSLLCEQRPLSLKFSPSIRKLTQEGASIYYFHTTRAINRVDTYVPALTYHYCIALQNSYNTTLFTPEVWRRDYHKADEEDKFNCELAEGSLKGT